jgi:hypothetical protein
MPDQESVKGDNPSRTHPEYDSWIDRWKLLRAATEGEWALKDPEVRELAIPPLSGHIADRAAYDTYVKNAYFFPATKRMRNAIVGSLFQAPPKADVPAQMKSWMDNVTGDDAAMTLHEFTKMVMREVTTHGRAGVLVDYPDVEALKAAGADDGHLPRDLTRNQAEKLGLQPVLTKYNAEEIVNWRVEMVLGRRRKTMVVLHEKKRVQGEDRFDNHKTADQYRVLELLTMPGPIDPLADGPSPMRTVYRVTIYTKNEEAKEGPEWVGRAFFPRRNGELLDAIPFEVQGSNDSTFDVDEPPLLDLLSVNLGLLRNSASYEHGLHWCGNPMPYITGYDPDIEEGLDMGPPQVQPSPSTVPAAEQPYAWRNATVKFRFGASEMLTIRSPQAKPGVLQAGAETVGALRVAMQDKREDMVAIGGRILAVDKRVAETEGAEEVRREGERGILATMANVVSESMSRVLEHVRDWLQLTGEVSFVIDADFAAAALNIEEAVGLSTLVNGEFMAMSDARHLLRRGRLLRMDRTDEQIDREVKQRPPTAMAGLLGGGGPPLPGDDEPPPTAPPKPPPPAAGE